MLKTAIASVLYAKLCQAPSEFFRSAQGREMCRKAVALVREKCGDEEATTLEHLLTVASVMPD